jgi:hypothetical protein
MTNIVALYQCNHFVEFQTGVRSTMYVSFNGGYLFHRLASEREQELQALQRCQEREMARLRGELEQQRQSLVS